MQDYGNNNLWQRVNLAESPNEIRAYLLNTSVDAGGTLEVEALSESTIDAIVVAGSVAVSGGGTGVSVSGAGAGALNKISNDVAAFIQGDGATGISAGAITLIADDDSTIDAFTGSASLAAGFGGTGVAVAIGIAGAYNTISNDISSYITAADNGVGATSGAINISATETADITSYTVAASLSAAIGGTGVAVSGAGAAAVNSILNRTNAYVEDSTITTTGTEGDMTIAATDSSSIEATVGAVAASFAGGGTGVGVSIGAAFALNTIGFDLLKGDAQVRAYIDDSTVTAGGDLSVISTADETIESRVLAGAVAIAGGGVGVGVAGSGVVALNMMATDIEAYIGGATGSTITAGSVSLQADDTSSIMAFGGAAAISGGFGGTGVAVSIGVSLAHNMIDNDVTAYIKDSTVTSTIGSIGISALEHSQINAVSASRGARSRYRRCRGVGQRAGAMASNVILTKTNAYIEDSVVTSADDLNLEAKALSAAPQFNDIASAALTAVGGANGFATKLDDLSSTDVDNEDTANIDESTDDITADNAFQAQLSGILMAQNILNSGQLAVTVRTAGSEWSITDRITGASYIMTRDSNNFKIAMPTIGATVISASAAAAAGGVGVGVSIGLSFATNLIGWDLGLDDTLYHPEYTTADELGASLTKGDRVKILEGVKENYIYEYIGPATTIYDYTTADGNRTIKTAIW